MGCNASQEPLVVPNENGNVTSSTAVDDDTLNDNDDVEQLPPPSDHSESLQTDQSPAAKPQSGKIRQSEPDVSISTTSHNSKSTRDSSSSPGNKMMTPKSMTPFSEAASPQNAEAFEGHKSPSAIGSPCPLASSVTDNGHQEEQEDEGDEETAVQSRTASAATKASSAASKRSCSQKSSQSIHEPPKAVEESVTVNSPEKICFDGASDLANNLASSTNKQADEDEDNTIELAEFGADEGTRFHSHFPQIHPQSSTILI